MFFMGLNLALQIFCFIFINGLVFLKIYFCALYWVVLTASEMIFHY